jgi:beta-alanine--pyruvate transaminase
MFGPLLVGAGPHPAHARSRANAFSRGLPEHGAEFADDLERVIALHDASTIAAVIVEPVAGSTGVLVPPKGCLERIRAIRDRQGVLLVFDEVITGFGRLGPPFAADFFGVTPDLMAVAEGITSGVVPMGAVLVRKVIYDALMQGPEHLIKFAHGYTYSGHPVACAAALGALDTYRDEDLFARAQGLACYWEDAVHSLKGEGPAHSHDRRHHRAVPAADHLASRDRPDRRDAVRVLKGLP